MCLDGTGRNVRASQRLPVFAMTLLLNIDVPDVETALRFYTTAFDLKVGRRFGGDAERGFRVRARVRRVTALQRTAREKL